MKNKYQDGSFRLKDWDYSWSAAYFITICTKNKVQYFGSIQNELMKASDIGEIAQKEWLRNFEIRSDMNLQSGAFVIMPNHIHAILAIGHNQYNKELKPKSSSFGPQTKNLSSIIRGFKAAVTIQARKKNIEFQWQPRFYDRIIRDKKEYENTTYYIRNNVKNWKEDSFNNL